MERGGGGGGRMTGSGTAAVSFNKIRGERERERGLWTIRRDSCGHSCGNDLRDPLDQSHQWRPIFSYFNCPPFVSLVSLYLPLFSQRYQLRAFYYYYQAVVSAAVLVVLVVLLISYFNSVLVQWLSYNGRAIG